MAEPRSISDDFVRGAIEHTLLRADATPAAIDALCAQALAHRFAAVCVNPIEVARCRAQLPAGGPRLVSVVGFPLGAVHAEHKAREAERAIAEGADEIDMVMRLGAAKAGDWDAVAADARAVVSAAQGRPVKLILEVGLIAREQALRACEIAVGAGIAFVKTCSGYAPGSAQVDDVAALSRALAGRAAIKASGGIRSAAQARALLAAGATRIGTSSGIEIALELASDIVRP
ncbi:MAG TPA: deoxyribose-phosphate aldolase [Polyangiales bacterium]|nr:deoxyribose-phosphate aldolase [Polyangiales bacterium]